MRRNEVWWADLQEPVGSGPRYRRPVLIIQSGLFNVSRIQTVIVAIMTSNVRLAELPGNVLVPSSVTGLKLDSVVNVSQVISVDRYQLIERVGTISVRAMAAVEAGLRMAMSL